MALTELLHRAYAPLAQQGLRFSATHQLPDVTAQRVARGPCFVLEAQGHIIGTIAVQEPSPDSPVPVYREHGTWRFGQFGIDPEYKGSGLARSLHQQACAYAIQNGAVAMALDTAAPATALVATYTRWGYAEVAHHRWEDTNYESVIMKRALP